MVMVIGHVTPLLICYNPYSIFLHELYLAEARSDRQDSFVIVEALFVSYTVPGLQYLLPLQALPDQVSPVTVTVRVGQVETSRVLFMFTLGFVSSWGKNDLIY